MIFNDCTKLSLNDKSHPHSNTETCWDDLKEPQVMSRTQQPFAFCERKKMEVEKDSKNVAAKMSRVSLIQLAWLLHFTGVRVYGSNGDASPDGFEVSNRASKTAWHTNRRQLSPIKFPSFRADWKLVPGEAAGKGNRSPHPLLESISINRDTRGSLDT